MRSAIDFALAYAALGWHVLPVEPRGKKPLGSFGLKQATTGEAIIREWFERWPDAGIGIALAPSRLAAIDIDPRNGGSLEALPEQLDTLTAKTGGGGYHLLVRTRLDATLPGKLGPGIDLKHRGYIVVEPSVHPSGEPYGWIGWDPLTEPLPRIADAPSWVLAPRPQKTGEGVQGGQGVQGSERWAPSKNVDTFDTRRAVAEILAAESYHDNLVRLAGHFVANGMQRADCVATLTALFESVELGARDARWQERVREIPSAAASAVRKFAGAETEEVVTLVRADSVTPEAINWLWDGWLPRGKLAIVAGAPGGGKTTLALGFAATVSTGGRWPDGTRAATGDVLIWSGEDDIRDTLVPRLAAMNADLSRVSFVSDAIEIVDGEPRKAAFDPARHLDGLIARIAKAPPALLIIDPIVSAIAGDSHKNTETRRGLQPLVDLARTLNVAVVGISHFSKGTAGRDPTERVTGSVAFGAVARVVMVAASKTEEDGSKRRVLMRSKSNIGADSGGYGYDIEQQELALHPGIYASAVTWREAVEGTARDMLAEAEAPPPTDDDEDESSALDEAKRFLCELLADGEVGAKQVRAAATDAGVSWRTVRRAKEDLRIKPRKSRQDALWYWSLPDDAPGKVSKVFEGAHLKNDGPLGPLGPLQDNLEPAVAEVRL